MNVNDVDQPSEWGDDDLGRQLKRRLPAWWNSTPPALRALRQEIPYHSMWNDPVALKQYQDAMLDADTTGPRCVMAEFNSGWYRRHSWGSRA